MLARSRARSGKDVGHDPGILAVGEGGGEPLALVDKLLVVEAEAVEERGVPVVVMDDVLHRLVAPLVGLAVGAAPLESPATHCAKP